MSLLFEGVLGRILSLRAALPSVMYALVHAYRAKPPAVPNCNPSPPSNPKASQLKVENFGQLYKIVNPLSLTRSVNIDCPHAGKYRAACKAAYRLLRRSKYRACGARIFQLSPYIFGVKPYEKERTRKQSRGKN